MTKHDFRKLSPRDAAGLRPYFAKCGYALSQYCLSSLLFWDNCINEEYVRTGEGMLLISERSIENPGKKHLFMPLYAKSRHPEPRDLAAVAAASGHGLFFWVPETYIECAGKDEIEKFFNIYFQEGYSDYIYERRKLAELKGSKYSGKRNLIKQFLRNRRKGEIETLEINPSHKGEIMLLLRQWERGGRADEILECEKKAIGNCLDLWKETEVCGIMVKISGQPAGFAIGSPLNDEIYTLNFEKARPGEKGLYQFLDNEFVKRIPVKYRFLNKESDLGKSGLRKSKLSYYPDKILNSYILELKKHPGK